MTYERNFPEDFIWGSATSAYQVEGGAHEDGKGPSIWNEFEKQPGAIIDNGTGDVTSNQYHYWRDDIRLMKEAGMNAYRFSLAWSRIMPDGKGKMEAYVDHYKWQPGAALHDWRACARLCNIPIRNGQVDIDGDVLIQKLVVMKNRIPANLRRSQFLFVPEEVQTALELGALKMSSNVVKIVEAAEQFKTNFFNVTIESDDAISKSEAQIS